MADDNVKNNSSFQEGLQNAPSQTNLEQRIADLEDLLRMHNHTGYDTTSRLLNTQVNQAQLINGAVLGDGKEHSGTLELKVADGRGDTFIKAGSITDGDFDNSDANSGFIMGIDDDDSDTVKFYFGDSTNNLVYDGTDLTLSGETVATVTDQAGTLFNKFVYIGNSNDGLTENINTPNGTITRHPIITQMSAETTGTTGQDNFYSAVLGPTAGGFRFDWDFNHTFISVIQTEGTSSDYVYFYGLHGSTTSTLDNGGAETTRHIGFFVVDGTLYASNADGTTQTTTELTGITITNYNVFRFDFTSGTDIKFYVDDVLKATHTTNLPSGESAGSLPLLRFSIKVNDTNVRRRLFISNNYSIFSTA